jgi:hypothetical protein
LRDAALVVGVLGVGPAIRLLLLLELLAEVARLVGAAQVSVGVGRGLGLGKLLELSVLLRELSQPELLGGRLVA